LQLLVRLGLFKYESLIRLGPLDLQLLVRLGFFKCEPLVCICKLLVRLCLK
jgi:hypothetical protein